VKQGLTGVHEKLRYGGQRFAKKKAAAAISYSGPDVVEACHGQALFQFRNLLNKFKLSEVRHSCPDEGSAGRTLNLLSTGLLRLNLQGLKPILREVSCPS